MDYGHDGIVYGHDAGNPFSLPHLADDHLLPDIHYLDVDSVDDTDDASDFNADTVHDAGFSEPGGLAHFDPARLGHDVIGDPSAAMAHWHQQERPDSCGIAVQGFALEELTGKHFSDEELRTEALTHGYYQHGGTPLSQLGSLLELHGMGMERDSGATMENLASELKQQHQVLAAVDGDKLRPELASGGLLANQTGHPGQAANHAVEVIGIDVSDPKNPQVVINDPAVADGCGQLIPEARFLAAWDAGGCYMAHTTGEPPDHGDTPNLTAGRSHEPLLAGYYNGDGTYHYSSDGTDRDAQTGAIIRRN